MSVVSLYSLPQIAILSTGTGAAYMNFPVNRADLSVAKNVKTSLSVFLRDIDRKPVVIGMDTLVLHVVDRRTRRVLLEKELIMSDPVKARYDVTILPLDVRSIEVGAYNYSITRRSPDGSESLIFTDRDRTEVSTFEVREGPLPPPVDPVVFLPDDFLIRNNSQNPGEIERYSGAVPGSAGVGNLTSVQSYAVSLNGFSGRITLQGSLDMSAPDEDGQWFDMDTHTFDAASTTVGFTVIGNPLWVRFKITEEIRLDTGDAGSSSDCGCGGSDAPVNTIVWPDGTPRGLVKLVYRS